MHNLVKPTDPKGTPRPGFTHRCSCGSNVWTDASAVVCVESGETVGRS